MTEHQKETGAGHVHDSMCDHYYSPAKIIAGSVIVASLIVSLSLFINVKLLVKGMGGDANLLTDTRGAGSGQAVQKGADAQANPGQPTPPAQANVNPRDNQPTLGKGDAKVTIYEFSDFQCPYCQRFFKETYSQLKAQYIDTGKVKFIFRHFPLPFHVNAEPAAIAAECANQQGKFWQYHDNLFNKGQADGTGLALADLKTYAASLGLDKQRFNQCLDNKSTLDIVNADLKEGTAVGVSGTPSFSINGKLLVGAQPLAAFKAAIDEALK